MSKLIVTGPDMQPREYEIEREMTLGRHEGNDINLREEKASRRHCRFRPQDEKIFVEDLQSSNGTKVNGRKIQTYVLKHGDTITIGSHTIVFQDESQKFDRTMVAPDEDGKMVFGMKAVSLPETADKSSKKAEKAKVEEEEEHEQEEEKPAETHFLRVGLLCVLLILVAICGTIYAKRNYLDKQSESSDEPDAPPPAPIPPKPIAEIKPVAPAPVVLPKPIVVSKKPVAKPVDPAVMADWEKAVAERDRAIGSGNFAGARAALNAFLTAHPKGESADRAREELKDTDAIIESAFDGVLTQAKDAAAAKKYRLMTQYCTRLISADAGGKFGTAAREMLTQVDSSSEPRFNEFDMKANDQVKLGQLDKASETLEKALDELGGTKWAEKVSSEQLQVFMARAFVRHFEAAHAKRAAGGKPIPVNFPSRKVAGWLSRINGVSLDVRSGGKTVSVPIKDLPPAELQPLLQTMGLTDRNLELAYLWILLEKPANAQAELENALKNPDQAGAAMKLVSMLPGQKNLKIYDFSKWQHQTDWDALSGSWSTQNDRYVLDSTDGGDTALKSAVIGGPFPAKNARISFDFELVQPGNGYFFAFELGDDQHALSVIFSAKGMNVHANLTGSIDEGETWAQAATHVDLSISGDALSLSINGGAAKTYTVSGLQDLKGTLAFRVRESACAIDNIIIRNVE